MTYMTVLVKLELVSFLLIRCLSHTLYMYINTHTHIIRNYIFIYYTYRYMHAYTHAYIHAYIHPSIHAHTYNDIYIYIIFVYIYMHIRKSLRCCFPVFASYSLHGEEQPTSTFMRSCTASEIGLLRTGGCGLLALFLLFSKNCK